MKFTIKKPSQATTQVVNKPEAKEAKAQPKGDRRLSEKEIGLLTLHHVLESFIDSEERFETYKVKAGSRKLQDHHMDKVDAFVKGRVERMLVPSTKLLKKRGIL
jgi:hypothetical protein